MRDTRKDRETKKNDHGNQNLTAVHTVSIFFCGIYIHLLCASVRTNDPLSSGLRK